MPTPVQNVVAVQANVLPIKQVKNYLPRKIMMDTRDRLVEVGINIDANNGEFVP